MKSYKIYLALMLAVFAFSVVIVNAQNVSVNYNNQSGNIEQKVFKQLIRLPNYGVFDNISYRVDGDTVFLYGKIINAVNRKDAEKRVEKIDGVGKVVNLIQILPLSSFDNSIRYRALQTVANGGSLYRYF
ncbi:MAG: BON domain-containing protein [Pyrinomonadaceae bacterium]